jgi:hypothetical protein
MEARKLFTFLIGAAIYVGRSAKSSSSTNFVAVDSISDAKRFIEEADKAKILPTDDDL